MANPAIELINSEWWRGLPADYEDRLEDRSLRDLRALLRRLIEAPAERDWAELDAILAAAPMRRRVRDGVVVLEPAGKGARWTRAEIAAAIVDDLAAGRVGICANDECQWAFIDTSKNHSRRWCGAPSCGDLARVHRHRARRAAR